MTRTTTPKLTDATCAHCGTVFMLHKWRVKKGGGKYCSMSCKALAQAEAKRNQVNKKSGN